MEVQLDDIIKKIQDEGIGKAKAQAQQIIDAAKKEAEQCLQEAKNRLKEAEKEKADIIAAGDAALAQSSRDLILTVSKHITAIYDEVIKETVAEALTPERVGEIIASLVNSWQSAESGSFEALVSERERDEIEKTVRARLSQKLATGVDVRPVSGSSAGFRIATKDDALYYDFSAPVIAELLAAFLNPRLEKIMASVAR